MIRQASRLSPRSMGFEDDDERRRRGRLHSLNRLPPRGREDITSATLNKRVPPLPASPRGLTLAHKSGRGFFPLMGRPRRCRGVAGVLWCRHLACTVQAGSLHHKAAALLPHSTGSRTNGRSTGTRRRMSHNTQEPRSLRLGRCQQACVRSSYGERLDAAFLRSGALRYAVEPVGKGQPSGGGREGELGPVMRPRH
jgi:hypothetical protein